MKSWSNARRNAGTDLTPVFTVIVSYLPLMTTKRSKIYFKTLCLRLGLCTTLPLNQTRPHPCRKCRPCITSGLGRPSCGNCARWEQCTLCKKLMKRLGWDYDQNLRKTVRSDECIRQFKLVKNNVVLCIKNRDMPDHLLKARWILQGQYDRRQHNFPDDFYMHMHRYFQINFSVADTYFACSDWTRNVEKSLTTQNH